MTATLHKWVTFIQDDLPRLKAGTYTLSVTETVNQQAPNSFSDTRSIAVAGQRFRFAGNEVVAAYPPDLANGAYQGSAGNVVLRTQTLPWQRTAGTGNSTAPWLALLVFNQGEQPEVVNRKALDLVPAGQTITVLGSSVTGVGAMPVGTVSYPGLSVLDYGESPENGCSTIDVPVGLFNTIAPSADDLPFLAHIRKVDTTDGEDDIVDESCYSVVISNRVAKANSNAFVHLVSLERMGLYLPGNNGTPSSNMPGGTSYMRLIVYTSWQFYANDMEETFKSLLENLNKVNGRQGLTTLEMPAPGPLPSPSQVNQAMARQAAGTLGAADGDVLVANSLATGYVPMDHRLRRLGHTVSWYRGPLVPYAIATRPLQPATCADATLRYNPQTGMFDTSYAAAWQLGQLLALQSNGFATTLYNWKQSLRQGEAVQAEQSLLDARLAGASLFSPLMARRRARLDEALPPIPDTVVDWIAKLKLLNGVPFSYLVANEGMLPPETIRFFHLDENWIEALVDGAFSIGRATADDMNRDARYLPALGVRAIGKARRLRRNNKPGLVKAKDGDPSGPQTGFLMRSQVVVGWPKVRVQGYSDLQGQVELPKLRMVRLTNDILFCLFDGVVQMVAFHEAPEQLHCGVEGPLGSYTTTLREVKGPNPGQQYLVDPAGGPPVASVPSRRDGQTLQAAAAALSIKTKLNNDFNQNLTAFTSAEYALEMVKGVVEVQFQLQASGR